MGKDSTTSQLDFLLFEEVSDRAAETISGGASVTTTSPELKVEVDTDDLAGVVEIPGDVMEALGGLFDGLVLGMLEPSDLVDLIDGILGGNGITIPTFGG